MTEAQRKLRNEMAEKYGNDRKNHDPWGSEANDSVSSHFKAGWDARNQDFQVLKEALERINHPGTWLDAVDSENAGDYIVNIAKQALEKVAG